MLWRLALPAVLGLPYWTRAAEKKKRMKEERKVAHGLLQEKQVVRARDDTDANMDMASHRAFLRAQPASLSHRGRCGDRWQKTPGFLGSRGVAGISRFALPPSANRGRGDAEWRYPGVIHQGILMRLRRKCHDQASSLQYTTMHTKWRRRRPEGQTFGPTGLRALGCGKPLLALSSTSFRYGTQHRSN